MQRIEIDATLDDVGGEAAAILDLGAGEAHGAQLLVGLQQEDRGLHRLDGGFEPQPDAAGGMDRDLLAHDRAHQPAEAGWHLAAHRVANVLQHACEIRIDLGEMPHRLLEVGVVEEGGGHGRGIACAEAGL